MRTFDGLDELSRAKGESLGTSDWHTVTQEQVNRFAEATGDHQWIHVDPKRATEGPFGTTIAHGHLTLSLVPLLSQQIFRVEGISYGLNYGCNRVRFPAPLPVGSRIRGHAELLDVVQAPQGAQVVVRLTVEVEGQDKPACVAETVSLLIP